MALGVLLVCGAATACGGGARSLPRTPSGEAPVAAPAPTSVQALYEAGRYQAVLDDIGGGADRDLWFAAYSAVRLGRPAEARDWLQRLAANPNNAWQVAGRLGLARLAGTGPDLDGAIAATLPYPTHPFVQLERGLGHMARREFADAAQAFERSLAADRRLAYAYYFAALAYGEVGQRAMMASRLETFVRLAPEAPELPEAQSLLSTGR